MTTQTAEETQLAIKGARLHLGAYGYLVHNHKPAAHHRVWILALMDASIDRLLIVAPPAHAKTQWVAIYFSAWALGRNPNTHIGCISNTARQANTKSVAVRDTLALNETYRLVFPGVQPDHNKGWGENEWYVQRRDQGDPHPSFLSSGVGGPITGARFDLLLLDDIADQENMSSAYQRQKLLDWVDQTAMSRLTPQGRVVSICTRWHEADPAAHFKTQGWRVIHMPAISDEGLALWPEQWSLEKLMAIKGKKGSHAFEGMYQGRPSAQEGSIIKRKWWQYYQATPPLRQTIQVWDTAFEEKTSADYSVCTTWGLSVAGYYVLDLWRDRVEYPDLVRAVKQQYDKYRPNITLIEDHGSGTSLIQSLKRETSIPIKPVKQDRDKVSRINAVTGIIEGGRVFLPEAAPWASDLVDECAAFPTGAHDDIVDTVSMALSYLSSTSGRVGLHV